MKSEFLVERQGKRFVLYAGLLDEAHHQGLKAIRTQLIQAPSHDNGMTAICFAEVTMDKGTFTGIGDASPENVSRMMAPHLIRMAETRAKARALRDSINVGVTAFEELGDAEDQVEQAERHARAAEQQRTPDVRPPAPTVPDASTRARPQPLRPAAATPAPAPAPPPVAAARPEPNAAPSPASPSQLNAIRNIGREQLGLTDQQIDARALDLFGVTAPELMQAQAAEFIRQMQASHVAHRDQAAPAAPTGGTPERGRA